MKKREGYLLVEILLSMFIFSVLVFVVSAFLKRVVIVEKAKKDNQKIQGFSYEGENNNIFVKENQIVFKLNELFYKIEFDKGKLYISDAEDLKKFGSRAEVGKFREARFEKAGELLIIKLNSDKNDSVRAVRI